MRLHTACAEPRDRLKLSGPTSLQKLTLLSEDEGDVALSDTCVSTHRYRLGGTKTDEQIEEEGKNVRRRKRRKRQRNVSMLLELMLC